MLTVSKKGGQKLKGQPSTFTSGHKGKFGKNLVVDGNTLVVSAPAESMTNADTGHGKAHVFTRASSDGLWELQKELPKLRWGSNTTGPFAISGNTIVAQPADTPGICVLTRENSAWRQEAQLTAPGVSDRSGGRGGGRGVGRGGGRGGGGRSTGRFGGADSVLTWPVDVSGDTAVATSTKGRIHVFERLASGEASTPVWTEQATLTISDANNDAPSINNLKISGDVLVASTQKFVGTVYVYVRSESGWTQEAKLTSPDGEFGSSVAIDGTTLVVGAADSGIAYVFERHSESGSWIETTRLAGEGKYISVAISGDKIVVGTPPRLKGEFKGYQQGSGEFRGHLCRGDGFKGSVQIYKRSGYMWEEDFHLEASDGEVSDLFGSSVAILGNTVVIGAPGDDDGRGAVYTL